LILNNLSDRARFLRAFVSSTVGEQVEFFTVGSGAAGSMFAGHATTASRLGSSFMVPTVTVDSLVRFLDVIPDLVKIDVEGAESYVLEGATDLAVKSQTLFFVEMHSHPQLPMSDNANRVLSWCRANSYVAWYMKDKSVLSDSSEIAHRGRCHLILVPKGNAFPNYLTAIEQSAPLERALPPVSA
jgi:FkbM family methyltransferase